MARHKEKKQSSGSNGSTKRGGGGRSGSNGAGSDAIAMKKAGSVNRITSSRDAGFTGQDAFGMGDDEIALDGGRRAAGRRRGNDNDDDDDDDDELDDLTQEEVLSLRLPSSGISTRYLHQQQQENGDDDEEDGDAHQATTAGKGRSAIQLNTRIKNRDRDLQPLTDARTSRFDKVKNGSDKKRKAAASDEEEQDSEEEGAKRDGEQQDSDDESAASSSAADPDKEDLKGSWATAGGYYLSKGEVARAEERQHRQQEGRRGQVDDEQREQEALELYEARRIQKEGKENLHEADYGLDSEGDEEDATRLADTDTDLSASARANGAQAPAKFDTREEAIAHLVSTEPELLALLDDLSRNAQRLAAVKAVVKNMQASLAGDNPRVGFGLLYQETLTTYLTTLVFYLHVRSHPSFPTVGGDIASAALDRLVKLREALSTLDDLGIGAMPEDEQRKDMYTGSDDEERDSSEEADGNDNEEDAVALEELDRETLLAQIGDLDDDELEALIAERQAIMEHEGLGSGEANGVAAKQVGKRRALQAAEDGSESDGEQDAAQPAKRSRKRRRTKHAVSSVGTGNTLGDLLNLAPLPASSRAARPPASASASVDSDLVDPTALSAGDAEDKAGRTKSLRFYTSKIAAASARRTGANRERGGGDDDVPYRSKERARAAVLQRQQHAQKSREAAALGAELDDADFGEDDLVDARAVSGSLAAAGSDPDAEGYYDLVSKGKKAARAAKKEAYDAAVEEDRAALSTSQPLDPNNPRAVNRMIMANKGLTPKRPKSVRNPRVKKRMRYESAQKKVASMKPVYKGGLGSASYEGEKSGISSKVVKSRAL